MLFPMKRPWGFRPIGAILAAAPNGSMKTATKFFVTPSSLLVGVAFLIAVVHAKDCTVVAPSMSHRTMDKIGYSLCSGPARHIGW
jgi:hypothetical protein